MRYAIALASILATFTLAAPSFAAEAPAQAAHLKHGGGKASFPMPAAAYKQKVDNRIAKARTRMESHAQKSTPEQAKEMRAKFDAGVARVQQEVGAATADGTVTAEEAKKVRDAMKAMHPHRRAKS